MNFITEETLNILKQKIKIQDLTNYNIEKSKDNKDIIRVNQSNKKIYIGSKYSVQRDIDIFMDKINDFNSETIFIIIGLATGEHIIELLKKIEDKNKVIIVEPDLNIASCFSTSEKKYTLDNENIVLCVEDNLKKAIDKYVDEISVNKIKIACFANYDKVYKASFVNLTREITTNLNNKIMNNATSKNFSELFTTCYINNIHHIEKSVPINKFKDKLKNKPAVIVSAGPSLENNISKLKGHQDKFIIITGARSLKALIQNSIIPDFIAMVDPGDINGKFLKEYNNYNIPLLFYEYTSYNALNEYNGDKIFFVSNQLTNDLLGEFVDNLPAGGSVAHTCTAFAMYMGCDPIIFMGQDFAYTNDKLHAETVAYADKNNIDSEKDFILVKDIFGDYVRTDRLLNIYRKNMESIIEFNKEVTFVNSTEGGAHMEGTIIKSLDKSLNDYGKENINKEVIKKIINENKGKTYICLDDNINGLKKVRNKCKEALKYSNDMYLHYKGIKKSNINTILKKLDDIDKFIKKNRKDMALVEYLIFPIVEETLCNPKYILSNNDTEVETGIKISKKSITLYKGIEEQINAFLPMLKN